MSNLKDVVEEQMNEAHRRIKRLNGLLEQDQKDLEKAVAVLKYWQESYDKLAESGIIEVDRIKPRTPPRSESGMSSNKDGSK